MNNKNKCRMDSDCRYKTLTNSRDGIWHKLIIITFALLIITSLSASVSAGANDIKITDFQLDGANTVSVTVSSSITLSVTGDPKNDGWQSTRYRIGGASGTWVCEDTPDHSSGSGSATESFTITAPATVGSYKVEVEVHKSNDCSSSGNDKDSMSRNNAIVTTACPDSDGDGHTDESCGGDDCNDGNDAVYTGADDSACDGVDNNCDGTPDDEYTVDSSCFLP
ncbi:MAG: putative metal-binding motif-containing protein, partial [Candidatus Altiarchaeota archaeon]|nr:putative metal-binding motif-containing protein [Candidatus Altiarchaeota archaeon]